MRNLKRVLSATRSLWIFSLVLLFQLQAGYAAKNSAIKQLAEYNPDPSVSIFAAVDSAPANSDTHSELLKPGKDISPAIADADRFGAIKTLLEKIYYGQQLQFGKDGVVFMNKEGRLPQKQQGYYHEYTLIVPGRPQEACTTVIGGQTYHVGAMLGKRGAERIVIGGSGQHIYYSPDHYVTFIELSLVR